MQYYPSNILNTHMFHIVVDTPPLLLSYPIMKLSPVRDEPVELDEQVFFSNIP